MANTYKTPGVYVEEISQLPPTVTAVATAIPAFISYTEKAGETGENDLHLKPKRINSLAEYELFFGSGPITMVTSGANSRYCLYDSLKLFFHNGGSICYIVSVGLYGTNGNTPVDTDFISGINTLLTEDEPTLILFPDAAMMDEVSLGNVQRAALAHCAGTTVVNRFAILDMTRADTKPPDAGSKFRVNIGPDNLRYGAVYTPWLVVNLTGVRTGFRELPPCGAIAGVYALNDSNRGVWKAPANLSLSCVIKPAEVYTQSQLEKLNVDAVTGKSINAIRNFTGMGTLVFGARTLAGNDNEWRYINVRRFFSFVEESVRKATARFAFEPNDAGTWAKAETMIGNFLYNLWKQGALQGVKPEHAFYVAAGLGKTMTAADISEGRMLVDIGMAVVRPAEFIILKIALKMLQS